MKNYVLCIAICPGWNDTVLLHKKRGPAGVVGRLNFPGGLIEPGEPAVAAASRELQEETGLLIPEESLLRVKRVGGPHFSLEAFTGICPDLHTAATMTDEEILISPLSSVLVDLVAGSHRYAEDFDIYLSEALRVLSGRSKAFQYRR